MRYFSVARSNARLNLPRNGSRNSMRSSTMPGSIPNHQHQDDTIRSLFLLTLVCVHTSSSVSTDSLFLSPTCCRIASSFLLATSG